MPGSVLADELSLSKAQARRLMLAHQGLWPPCQLPGKAGILAYIRRVGCIQFDPLNIVGRNPELVLQSRVAGFQPAMLDELLYQDRQLVDGWDKNMSIYGVQDWPYFARRREAARRHPGKSPDAVYAAAAQVYQAIEERGPLSSLDLDLDQVVDWAWAPTRLGRAVLESMYFWGDLVIHHKVRTRKVYDLARRHIPAELLSAADPNETEEQYRTWYVRRRIGSLGLLWNRAGEAWLEVPAKSKERQIALDGLLAQGLIRPLHVVGIDQTFYMRREDEPTLDQVLDLVEPPPCAAILAPLDNLLWDRELTRVLFDLDYRWEVYKPATERRYGYYVLPILYGDRFIARFEPGRDKKSGALIVKNWWWEDGISPSDEVRSAIKGCFERFMRYLGTDELQVNPEVGDRPSFLPG